MSLEFFVATDDEVTDLNDFESLVNLTFRYKICASGAGNFQDFKLLLEFFLQNEDYVPNKVIKSCEEKFEDVNLKFEIYKLKRKLIENVAQIDKAKLDNPISIEFWQSRGYFSQGTWNYIFGFHNLCNYAVRDGKNLYLVEIIE
jgi:hypothetical protein